jgi:hypothetical protein
LNALAFELEYGLLKKVERLEEIPSGGNRIDTLIVKESHLDYR